MTEWKSIKEYGKPDDHCLCYINNVLAGMDCFLALYNPDRETFIEYDPTRYHKAALDVTHYVQLPWAPKKE